MKRHSSFLASAASWAVFTASAAHAQNGQPPPNYGQPPPNYGQPPPNYGQPPPGPQYSSGYPGYYQEPPPPPRKPENDFEIPDFSVRLDPLNWLLNGRLGFEFEVQVWKFISFETVPVFVVNESPPLLNLHSRDESLTQHSNGLGALSGTSLGAGFWLDGKPFQGNVLRIVFTNYGYEYRTEENGKPVDSVVHTERQLYGFLGSYARWGFFTIGGGIGLGVELNKQQRCFANSSKSSVQTEGCNGDLQLALHDPVTGVVNVNEATYPIVLLGRLSLGAVF